MYESHDVANRRTLASNDSSDTATRQLYQDLLMCKLRRFVDYNPRQNSLASRVNRIDSSEKTLQGVDYLNLLGHSTKLMTR